MRYLIVLTIVILSFSIEQPLLALSLKRYISSLEGLLADIIVYVFFSKIKTKILKLFSF